MEQIWNETSGFNWIDHKELDLNKYTSNSSTVYVLEVNLECPKELRELHNEYSLSPDKIKIKREMLSNYQLEIADFYNIAIGNVKKLTKFSFWKEDWALDYNSIKFRNFHDIS